MTGKPRGSIRDTLTPEQRAEWDRKVEEEARAFIREIDEKLAAPVKYTGRVYSSVRDQLNAQLRASMAKWSN